MSVKFILSIESSLLELLMLLVCAYFLTAWSKDVCCEVKCLLCVNMTSGKGQII